MKTCAIAVDIGTSSLKAALIDSTGDVRAATRVRFPRERRIAAHWLAAFDEGCAQLARGLDEAPSRAELVAICVSGNGPTLVSVGKDGTPGPILLWNDPVPAPDNGPTSAGGSARSLFIPRIAAYEELFPREWDNAETVLSGPEFLIWALTRTAVTALPEPRFVEAYWDDRSLAAAAISPSKLPKLVPIATVVGLAEVPAAFRPRAKTTVPVIAGGPDFVAALVGTNALAPGKACDRAGTSEGLNVCTATPIADPAIRTLPSASAGLWNAAYLLPDTGARFNAWRRERGLSERAYAEIMADIENDERAPGRDIVEAIGKEVRAGIQKLKAATGHDSAYTLSGGQARNEIWNRMKADMTGATFELTATPDGELMGNAAMAFAAIGEYPSVESAAGAMVKTVRVYEPDGERSARYAERFSIP